MPHEIVQSPYRTAAHAISTDYLWMMLPLLVMASYLYGPRCLALAAVAWLTANICDRVVAVMRSRVYDRYDNSSEAFALIMVMLFPASVSYYVVIVAVVFAVLAGKEAFGGYGVFPFHPSALGYAIAAVCWPEQIFSYPVPFAKLSVLSVQGASLTTSAAHAMRAGGLPNISLFNLVLGNYAGSMGVTAALLLVACAAYLWIRKRFPLQVFAGYFVTCAFIAFCFPRVGGIGLALPWQFLQERLLSVAYELLGGAVLYAGIFLVTEPVTAPKSMGAKLLYGILMGFMTMMFRYYGTYDLGVCFAVLCVNALSGYLDRALSRKIRSRGV